MPILVVGGLCDAKEGGMDNLTLAQVAALISHPFERGGGCWQLSFAHAAPMSTRISAPNLSERWGSVGGPYELPEVPRS